jgi:hypothetical protein
MMIAVAGRRIDATDAPTSRFPLVRAGAVREKLLVLFRRRGGTALVSSAACGADLLALDAARQLGMQLRIVLPFDRATFRRESVIDRPGDWGPLYDEICAEGEVIEMGLDPSHGQEAYEAATVRILDEGPALAVAVSDGVSRGTGDLTEFFVTTAKARGIDVERVDTLRD